ncbi:amidohydrolase [Ancylomarina salipaludis]|uniref:Amidohydrolase n=1 Tax=Ancylomarina salipaludis TaxID=2501299 RepID=A0A4Q1JL40_9BACT|nr:amidohydrolase [Ancylomarina salipaludis]RXQ92220.1 amidohydrolase [Ancylomarina salipaludis]
MNKSIEEKIIAYRRHFHALPELGWLEYATAAFIADELETLGFEVKKGSELMQASGLMGLPSEQENRIAFERAEGIYGADKLKPFANHCTAVAGILDCGEGPTVALRFDMDALPIKEAMDKGHEPFEKGFVSENTAVMHACGHDAHMAIGLGLAHCLINHTNQIKGKIILLFQPAEEGVRGAAAIVKSGFLKDVDYLLAAHLWSNMPMGQLVCSQNGTAATDKLDVIFYGRAAHAGICPEKGNNAILAAANCIVDLHAIKLDDEGFFRVNVGRIEGGTARNIIADKAKLEIELRASNRESEYQLLQEAEKIIASASGQQNCSFEILKQGQASGAVGDLRLAKCIKKEAEIKPFFSDIILSDEVNRGSEDFTSLMHEVQIRGGQACFIGIGASLNNKCLQHHTPDFDIDERVLCPTVELFASLIKKLTL